MLLTLAAGNVTLRPDRVFDALKRELGAAADVSDVVKTEQYFRTDGALIAVPDAMTVCAEHGARDPGRK